MNCPIHGRELTPLEVRTVRIHHGYEYVVESDMLAVKKKCAECRFSAFFLNDLETGRDILIEGMAEWPKEA